MKSRKFDSKDEKNTRKKRNQEYSSEPTIMHLNVVIKK